MISRRFGLALGCGAYLAFTLATFPADVAYRWFAPPGFRLSGVGGSVWSGRAAYGSLPGLPLQDLRWQIGALPLLWGRVSAAFEARLVEGFVSGRARLGAGSIRLEDLTASTDLTAFGELLPLGAARGLVSLRLDAFELSGGWPSNAIGRLNVSQLQVVPFAVNAGNRFVTVGDYEVVFKDSGGQGLVGELRDTGGPLAASGSLSLDLSGAYLLAGDVRPRADADELLLEGIRFLAVDEPDAEGWWPLEFDGSL